MTKETRKQIVEQTRNEVAKQYKAEINSLKERLNTANEKANEYWGKYVKERNRADELQEKVNQYEDWNRRLQEYMDMEPDAREKAFAEKKVNRELNEKLNDFMGVYGNFFSAFNI